MYIFPYSGSGLQATGSGGQLQNAGPQLQAGVYILVDGFHNKLDFHLEGGGRGVKGGNRIWEGKKF
jgi:hypothetical protein